ncbi:MAG: hypothetical protein O7C63_07580 [Alphaproteobacteria bacterium]|nr:hypothetical protein [Alphaproteobacteria bacterium]
MVRFVGRFKKIIGLVLALGLLGFSAAPAAAIGPAVIAGAAIGGLFMANMSRSSPHGLLSGVPFLGFNPFYDRHGSRGSYGSYGQGQSYGHGSQYGGPGFASGHGAYPNQSYAPSYGGHSSFGFAAARGFHGQANGYGGNCRSLTDTVIGPAGRHNLVRFTSCFDGYGGSYVVPGSIVVHQTF